MLQWEIRIYTPSNFNCCTFMHTPQLGSKLRVEILTTIIDYYRSEIRFNVSHTSFDFVSLALILITSTSRKNLDCELTQPNINHFKDIPRRVLWFITLSTSLIGHKSLAMQIRQWFTRSINLCKCAHFMVRNII